MLKSVNAYESQNQMNVICVKREHSFLSESHGFQFLFSFFFVF